ncbi:competence protein CoiA [Pedobacter sp. D749]|uniref:competence protein CoiA n=1 Tax=Pedobacter sp. D749 TaxID=2856523 RepID=UPI001C5A0AC5|nr:competence protein CoiA family protein [Pedobacter sp. D749]QXU43254.1 competence protein [Pedobacter sp. D749]
MQYAYVDNIKSEPIKGSKGLCCGCGNYVIAKCGTIKLHHWAHISTHKCDSWWENETEWHREWKSHFPVESREVSFYDDVLNEYHRADVHNKNGITIEFQNSPLTSDELKSRNDFYKKIIWVVNGFKFKGFEILENIPDPTSEELMNYNFNDSVHLSFMRKSEARNRMVEMLSRQSKELRHIQMSELHYSFLWKHAHKAWYGSTMPVFIDFGGKDLYWLKYRVQETNDYLYLKKISKSSFLLKYS